MALHFGGSEGVKAGERERPRPLWARLAPHPAEAGPAGLRDEEVGSKAPLPPPPCRDPSLGPVSTTPGRPRGSRTELRLKANAPQTTPPH